MSPVLLLGNQVFSLHFIWYSLNVISHFVNVCNINSWLQLVERGVLLPAQPSSDSLTASDLDFSDLSLDASMDQLSRMADSLAEGVPPGSMALGFAALPAGGAQLAGSMPAGSGRSANYMSHGSLGSWNGLHQNRPGSQYNDRTVRQEEARQSHSGAQHSKRAPASPHACPTCCDLISEETQSDFASRLDGCSKSDTESDSKGESDSEAELLSSQVPAHRGRAAGTSPMAAQSGSHAAPPSEGISPRPFSPAHLQHRESCHQPAGTRTFPAHKQQTAAVKGSLQQQYSDSDMQQSLNLGSNDSGADDSSCFSSMPTSPQSSLQQGNAGTGLAADASSWRADAALQGKTGIWASEGPGMKPSAATASHHSALPLHSTKPALQDSSLLRPHHEPTPAAPHPTHAAFLCTHMPVVAKAPAAVKHHAASATAEGHSKRDAARSQAFLKQHSSLHSRQSVQSREAHGADVAAQPWLNDNAQAKAFASGFGTGSVQSLSEDSVPPDAAPAASEEADDSHVPSTAGASEAAARPRSADGVENAQQSKSDTVSEASDTHHNTNACAAVVTAAVHAAEPVLACGQLAERSQSEEEFEKTLADARRLRPSNQAQGHVRYTLQYKCQSRLHH